MYKHPTFLPIEETETTQMYEFPNGAAVYVVAKKLPDIFDIQIYDFRNPEKIVFLGNAIEARNQTTVKLLLETTAALKVGDF
jgi:hypothetical protein